MKSQMQNPVKKALSSKNPASLRVFSFALAIALLGGCVTVNVNFPESAVQKASDDYVKELYKAKEKGRTSAPSPTPGPSAAPNAASAWDLLIPSARADDGINLRVDSPKAMKIRERQVARLDEIHAEKAAGVLGEGNDGKLVLKDPGKLKPLLKKKAEQLVKDENSDRTELYEEIQKQNSLPKSGLKTIERSFAKSFQEHSPPGTWIQDEAGEWSQKP